jgi:hypothetical protein
MISLAFRTPSDSDSSPAPAVPISEEKKEKGVASRQLTFYPSNSRRRLDRNKKSSLPTISITQGRDRFRTAWHLNWAH